jgi:hypothetical protein
VVLQPLCLTDLHEAEPGLSRTLHGVATWGTWQRAGGRFVMLAIELARALPRDILRAGRRTQAVDLIFDEGAHWDAAHRRVALYVHYAASGEISEMVRQQLRIIARAGFAVVFISNASNISETQWQAVQRDVALAVRRANFGLDFGAWRDVMPEVARRWPIVEELLLANDSVLGPVYPLEPVIETMRAGGDGLFGLTESLQGGPHLQSYMLLARGTGAVRDLMEFLRHVYVSHSKWLLIQVSELRLARWMRQRRHRVAAVFGYDRLVQAAVADPAERQRLAKTQGALSDLDTLGAPAAVARLYRWPLNPTWHLWHLLATQFHYPFIKTDVVRRGPAGNPEPSRWEAVVPDDAPCPSPVLKAHLETLKALPR